MIFSLILMPFILKSSVLMMRFRQFLLMWMILTTNLNWNVRRLYHHSILIWYKMIQCKIPFTKIVFNHQADHLPHSIKSSINESRQHLYTQSRPYSHSIIKNNHYTKISIISPSKKKLNNIKHLRKNNWAFKILITSRKWCL